MRLEHVQRNVETGGIVEVSKATIKATPKIFDMFANDTYANKPLAITRELAANAIDAHTAAGKPDVPITVTLPTEFNPVFSVKDEGIGMSHEFVMGPFMQYTNGSTKDGDNDQIGGFGIGSKSPFAYTDQYTLRVVYNGVVSVYSMFKDEDGIPAIGLQAQTTTDEPNGVEVSFPVDEEDRVAFREAAQEALQYFQPLPKVIGGEIKPPEYDHIGQGWALRPQSGPLGVIMGGVRYPVSKDNLEYALRYDKTIGALLDYGIDITLPIGAAGVAMSREQLSYTPKTNKAISEALGKIVTEVIATFATMFDDEKTLWRAMQRLYKETKTYGARSTLIAGNAKFKGKTLEAAFTISRYANNLSDRFNFHQDRVQGISSWYLPDHRSSRMVPKWQSMMENRQLTPGKISHVFVDDLPLEPKSRTTAKLRHAFESLPQRKDVLMLRAPSKAKLKALLKLLGSPPVTYTSSLPVPPSVVRTKSTRQNIRMFTYDGGTDRKTRTAIYNLSPSNSKRFRVKELVLSEQPDSGIVVVMKTFQLPAMLHKQMATKLVKWEELVFINEGDIGKLPNTFRKFDEVYAERKAAALAKYPEISRRLAVANNELLSRIFTIVKQMRQHLPKLSKEQMAKPFGQALVLYDKYVEPITDEERALAPEVTPKLPKGVSPEDLDKAILKEQPEVYTLLNDIGGYRFHWDNPKHIAVLLKLL